MLDFAKKMIDLNEMTTKQFGKKRGDIFFSKLMNLSLFIVRMDGIIQELDLYKSIYVDSIFSLTEKFYESNFKNNLTDDEEKLMEGVYGIIGKPNHNFSDEITLLFYVGLYHKIENYENEILQFYNLMNETKFKDLKNIGIDTAIKKNLFEDRDRIRLISNSIKHNNYYPKNELLKFYPYLKADKKISLNDFNPFEDMELIKGYIKYFNLLITFKNLISKHEKLNSIIGKETTIEFENYFNDFMKDESYKDENSKYLYFNQIHKS